jgi:hypothetical protein
LPRLGLQSWTGSSGWTWKPIGPEAQVWTVGNVTALGVFVGTNKNPPGTAAIIQRSHAAGNGPASRRPDAETSVMVQ